MSLGTPTFVRAALAAILSATAAVAQTGAIGGYTLGFVYDGRVSALRPLVGIPGAALLGAPLDTGGPIRNAYMAPAQNYAVALTDAGAVVVQFVSATDPPTLAPLGFDSSAASVVALSPNGSAGAFYSPNEALIRIVTGLPAAPTIARTVSTSAVSGTIRLLAIGNDAAALVAATDVADSDAIVLLDANGDSHALAASTHVSALQLVGAAQDLLVADDADDTVSLIQDVTGTGAVQLLADNSSGIDDPVALNVASDGRLVVANGQGATVVTLAPDGSQQQSYPCPCTPAALSRLNGSAVFLLNSITNSDPLWIFDGDSATPRVVFLPVDQGGASVSGQ
jgi:hypothetical protein